MTCRAELRESRKEQGAKKYAKCVIELAHDVSMRACDVSVRASRLAW